ncbi:MAG: CheR family methyltransferase [bacterium]
MSRPTHAPVRKQPPRARGWSDDRFAHVADVALTVAGLVFPPNRQPSAESAMRRVMSALQIAEPEELLRAVARPGEARDALLAELTVGESYFFRESAALSVLERELVNGRRASGREDEPLRIWSAGCATGEEPYTLAMLLRELGWQQQVHILGTDISRPRLDAARRGRYTQWSLRGVSPARIARWFGQRGKHFIVDEGIRESVRFVPLNFISDEYPSASNGTADQDLILCRNVLIYFDLPTVAQIAAQLLRSLRPTGWLLLGASDPPLADLVECRVSMSPSGVLYQRADAEPRVKAQHVVIAVPWIDEHVVPDWATPDIPQADLAVPAVEETVVVAGILVAAPAIDPAAAAYMRGDYRMAAEHAERAIELGTDDVTLWVVWIRALANGGELARAGEVTAAAIDRHRLVSELHYLHGMLLLEGGRVSEGALAARRALYLDREFVIGYMLLGDGLSRLGDLVGARRAFENAIRQLARVSDDVVVPAGDGVLASRMRQIATERLRALSVRA